MIKHKILSVEKIDEGTLRLKSQILMTEVINGYGGGTLMYDAPLAAAASVAREKLQWKLTAETNPMKWTPIFEEDFSVLEDYLLSLVPEPVIIEPSVEPSIEPAPEEA